MASQWYYSKDNQQHGPVSSEQLKQLANSGQLQPSDLIWKEGMAQWTEARKMQGLFPPVPAASNPPPVPTAATSAPPPVPATPVVATSDTSISGEAPALWNPKWLGAWSLLFSWAFGAFLLARNWKALGEPGKAKRAMIWFYAVIPWYLLTVVVSGPPGLVQGMRYSWLGILAIFLYIEVAPQIKLVKERFADQFPRRSWGKPVGIAVGALVGLIVLGVGVSLVVGTDAGPGQIFYVGKSEVFYKSPVTGMEVRSIGNHLADVYSLGDQEITIQIRKQHDVYQLRFVLKKGASDDPDVVKHFGQIGRSVSHAALGDAPVEVHLCDDKLNTIRVVKP